MCKSLSFEESTEFIKIPHNRNIKLGSKYSNQYTAGGNNALINTIRGGYDFKTGNWQGYYGKDLEAILDLGDSQYISKVGIGFLQDENSWIFMPLNVKFEYSLDGKNYITLGIVKNTISQHSAGAIIKDFTVDNINKSIKFLKVTAINQGTCPDWHKGAGNPCWIFTDEIWVE
jgi:hypothetical protein